jgi:GNAT superfamily N-acetyltransferase
MSVTITTRVMTDADLEPVLDLMKASLGETPLLSRTRELFEWKHIDNPFGRSIVLVAEADDRLVGLRAFMRWDLTTTNGETIHCVRAVDTATHPDYQRLGIFRRLTLEAVEEAGAQGVDMIFNTPNAKSGPGYLKMGWTEVGKIDVLIRPKAPLLTGDRTAGLEPAHALAGQPREVTLEGVHDRAPRGLRTVRSDRYFKWRFTTHPTARYFQVEKDDSFAVVRPNVRSGRTELLIADLFGPNLRSVTRQSIRMARTAYVGASFSQGSPERSACVRSGLMLVPWLSPMTLMARPLKDLTVEVSSLRAWDLSLGDLELL